jgi:ribosomal protein S18 acetylase RimI-like enzyme
VKFEVREARRDDAEQLLEVWIARDIADTGEPDYTLDDVEGDFDNPEAEIWVADADGRLLAAGILDDRGGMISTHPDHEGLGAGTALRQTLERRARERGMNAIRMYIITSNTTAQRLLAAAGYAVVFHFVKLESSREDLPIETPDLPGLRPFRVGEEDREVHDLVATAFATIPGDVPTSYEAFRAEMLDRAGFAPECSFAVDDDEGVCGAVLCQDREGVGYVGDLAVHPRAQGRGLGRCLLLAALASFRATGKNGGYLWVNGANAPALGLYESAGMHETLRSERWEKVL